MEDEVSELDLVAFDILNSGGTAKGCAYEALDAAAEGDFDRAEAMLRESDKHFLEAHNIQTEILRKEAAGQHQQPSVLFMHAQDHLMTGLESRTLIEALIKLYRRVKELEDYEK